MKKLDEQNFQLPETLLDDQPDIPKGKPYFTFPKRLKSNNIIKETKNSYLKKNLRRGAQEKTPNCLSLLKMD